MEKIPSSVPMTVVPSSKTCVGCGETKPVHDFRIKEGILNAHRRFRSLG